MNLRNLLRKHGALLLIMLAALGLRLWYLTINPLWPQFSSADDGDYFQRALRLAVTGKYVDDLWLIRPPFHVWIFAGWLKLGLLLDQPPAFGVRLIQGFQVALGVLMVALCYALAARLFNRRAGLIFATFWAIWFPFVELPATLFSEPVYLFLFTLHLWLLLRFADSNQYRYLGASGIVLGMAALTRSPALYALAFAVPWLVLRNYRSAAQKLPAGARLKPWIRNLQYALRRSIAPLAVLAACTLAVVLPWTARNWVVYQRFIPVDTLGPINLWLDLGQANERDAKIAQLRQLPQADRQAFATERVKEMLRAEPLRPLRNVWPTFRHIWKGQYVEDYWVKRSFFTRPLREAAPLGLFGDVIWLVGTLAGFVGLLHPRTDRPFKLLIGLWLLYSFATVLIFHVEPRYLLSIWLLLGLYASWTLSQARQWIAYLRGRRWRAAIIASTIMSLALLTVTYRNYPAIVAKGLPREWHMLQGDRALQQGDFALAEREFRAALAIDPQFIDGEVALAVALGAQNRPQEGIAVLTPEASRRSILVEGVLRRAINDDAGARSLLSTTEYRMGEDAQRWALEHVRVEPRNNLVLGNDALDLGYIAGFAEPETNGERSYRWLSGDGEIVVPLSQPLVAGSTVMLEMAAPLELDGPVRITLNDGPAVSLRPVAGWRAYYLGVPPALAGEQVLRIRIQAPTRLPMRDNPESNDPRALSVMVHQVGVDAPTAMSTSSHR